ncbi:helix-turn-helix domain-containing protein [Acidobacteria bacterium AH-259-D05]|nr:helix-turn-helix domain-containing protein [Acidobacteria bacterium AH-259-D05]
MTEFQKFVEKRTQDRGSQGKLARKLKVSTSTITMWKRGSSPEFESCLRIADHFKIDPLKIFGMAERDDYAELYKKFFPDYEPKNLTEEDLYENPVHAKFHAQLQDNLNSGVDDIEQIVTRDLLGLELVVEYSLRQQEMSKQSTEGLIELFRDPTTHESDRRAASQELVRRGHGDELDKAIMDEGDAIHAEYGHLWSKEESES